jgi:hypothetical protein
MQPLAQPTSFEARVTSDKYSFIFKDIREQNGLDRFLSNYVVLNSDIDWL